MRRWMIMWMAIGLLGLGACQGAPAPVEQGTDSAESAPISTPTISPSPAPSQPPPTQTVDPYADLEIVTLLPRDAIPAVGIGLPGLEEPRFLTAAEANSSYQPDELILGVAFNGDIRAYSVPFLSSHEIVNDTVGGVKIAVTW